MKRLITGMLLVVCLLVAWMIWRVWRVPSRQLPGMDIPAASVDSVRVIEHVAQGLRFPTVSVDGALADTTAFEHFLSWLRVTYPRVHAHLNPRYINYSVLFTWKGTDTTQAPGILMAHMDVVPPGDTTAWSYPPFSGQVAEGYLWGRGALDDKGALLMMLEAVEHLLEEGFTPRRTLLFAFGHDEEQGGRYGARAIVRYLQNRGIEPEFVIDEGGFVTSGLVPGMEAPVALIGIAEKGYMTLEITARGHQGHSSMPPPRSAIGRLSETLYQLERHPMPARMDGATRLFFETLAPEMPFAYRLLFANLWLTRPLVMYFLERSPSSAAMLRTTTALTVVRGGVKENVIPAEARALVNFRLLPGDSASTVQEHVEQFLPDTLVSISLPQPAQLPSPVSSVEHEAYRGLHQLIRSVFPGTVVAPYLLLGATDSRHYRPLTPQIYRFQPFYINPQLLGTVHGVDERVSLSSLVQGVRFYQAFLRSL